MEHDFPPLEPRNNVFILNDLKELKRDARGILSPYFDYGYNHATKWGPEAYKIPCKRQSTRGPKTRTIGTQTMTFEPKDWIRYSWAVDDRVNEST